MDRRQFLQLTTLGAAATVVAVGAHSWAVSSPVPSTPIAARPVTTGTSGANRLIVVFLRGGVDGLNVIVPYQEAAYYQARPTIAIPKPGQSGGALDLDGQFGLHPALAPVLPLWKQGSLAFVQACGSPDPSRSHFDAQDYMESGTPGQKTTQDGWMGRLLDILPQQGTVQSLAVGANIPRILRGDRPSANISSHNPRQPLYLDRAPVAAAFNRLYRGNDELSHAYQEGQKARATLLGALSPEREEADNGAPSAASFVLDARRMAELMVKQPSIQLGFMAIGGWDTHIDQGGSTGDLATSLGYLGQGLAVLVRGLGSIYADTTIVVMSEFGRTVRENGDGGTDHGHGNTLWLLGGGVRGGKVYGQWPGLATNQLYEQRDLAITTDFRDPLAAVLTHHMGMDDTRLSQIFPGYQPSQALGVF